MSTDANASKISERNAGLKTIPNERFELGTS
jgi:hypothetical protein